MGLGQSNTRSHLISWWKLRSRTAGRGAQRRLSLPNASRSEGAISSAPTTWRRLYPFTTLALSGRIEVSFRGAISLHERGLQIRLAALGPDDQQVADSLDLLALALIRLERFQEAGRKLDESQRIRESQPVHSPLPLARTLELVGQLHRYSGSYTAAVAPLERALAIQPGLASEHPDIIDASSSPRRCSLPDGRHSRRSRSLV